MRLGYNTNGFAHHNPLDAIQVLAELGYRSIALTIDHGLLNPYDNESLAEQLQSVRRLLSQHGLASVIETGARFLLDARHKHEPTLMTAAEQGRARRVQFLKQAIDIAKELDSDCVSFWAGVVRDDAPDEMLWSRLLEGLRPVIDYAADRGVALGFEPEPGMFIDTMSRFSELLERLDDDRLRLTLDVGHLHCLGETPIEAVIHRWGPHLVNVHIEDMKAGVHEHLMFGDGEMDFPPILAALEEVRYAGGVHVELSRHSHQAPTAARQAFEFLSSRGAFHA